MSQTVEASNAPQSVHSTAAVTPPTGHVHSQTVACDNEQSLERVREIKKRLAARNGKAKKEKTRRKVKHLTRVMESRPKEFTPMSSLTTLGKKVDMDAVRSRISQLKQQAVRSGQFPKL
ncbi:hypothetical protein HDE_06610 [Halotydeus destructor]|nr:hypothetical protein HDE_06610 [Halotydeus destructor]